MSALDLRPAAQIAKLNDRNLALKTFIRNYRKLVERTMFLTAESAITKAETAQDSMRKQIHTISNQEDIMQESAVLVYKSDQAKALLAVFEEQTKDLERIEKGQLGRTNTFEAGFECHTASHMEMIEVVNKVRDFGRALYDFFHEVNKTEADRLKEHNAVWRKVTDLDGEFGDDEEFIKLVAMWSKMNH